MEKKIVIIGGGPAGYAAAIRAAQLGAQVILAEERDIGGTCLNIGCIPTKALLHTSGFFHKLKSKSVAGIIANDVSVDWHEAQTHKMRTVRQLTNGVEMLLSHNGVTVIKERAIPMADGRVKIGSEEVTATAVILATGSQSAKLNFPGSDLPEVVDSAAALSFDELPESIVIVGGGVIGVEFATLFYQLGVKVTILEMLPKILPSIDTDAATRLREVMENEGVDVRTGATLKSVLKGPSGLTVNFSENGAAQNVTADRVLIAAGRKPNTEGLGLEETGVRLNRGAVEVDEYFRTSVPGIYAVGDCNGQNMLAHAAMAQGIAAAGHIMGETPNYDPKVVPACVYSCPEIASVGITEESAREGGSDYSVGLFSLSGNGKALIEGESGFVKIIADNKLGEIMGVHIVAPRATEIIAEAALCMRMEGTAEDIVRTVHAHPTVSEAFNEAALSVFGKPIHSI